MNNAQTPLTAVHTANAPAAIGPYSQAVCAGGFVYVSGQIPLDPATGEFAGPANRPQPRKSMKTIAATLAAAGSGMARVVNTTVLLKDIGARRVRGRRPAQRRAGRDRMCGGAVNITNCKQTRALFRRVYGFLTLKLWKTLWKRWKGVHFLALQPRFCARGAAGFRQVIVELRGQRWYNRKQIRAQAAFRGPRPPQGGLRAYALDR